MDCAAGAKIGFMTRLWIFAAIARHVVALALRAGDGLTGVAMGIAISKLQRENTTRFDHSLTHGSVVHDDSGGGGDW